jgi:hypothetical protein
VAFRHGEDVADAPGLQVPAQPAVAAVVGGRHTIFGRLHKSLMATWRPSPMLVGAPGGAVHHGVAANATAAN